jgi:1-deoxy-D-xylulose 5-phosphate reductoisomerase
MGIAGKETGTEMEETEAASSVEEKDEITEEVAKKMLLTQLDGIKVIIHSRLIVLSPLKFEDYPLTRVLEHADMSAPTEYQSLVMAKLINSIIARSKLTPEDISILRGSQRFYRVSR